MRGLVAALMFLSSALAADDAAPAVTWVKDSTVPLVQLTGETFQYFSNGYHYKAATYAQTLTRSGLNGADLGIPVTFPDKMLFLFGDSWGYSLQDKKYVWHPGWGKDDSIGFIDLPFNFNACHTMENIDQQIKSGARPPTTDNRTAPLLKFLLKPKPIESEPDFQPTRIAGLQPGQELGPYEVPTGAFALNGYLYLFYNVKHQEQPNAAGEKVCFFLNSVLARSDQTYTQWKSKAPPTFTRLYDFSEHERVADVNAPPSDLHDVGKFIHAAPVVMDHAALESARLLPLLPPDLQKAKSVIFVWGSSWRYVHSNLFLAAIASDTIDTAADGKRNDANWWFCSGVSDGRPVWCHDEAAAAPLLDTWRPGGEPCIGEHSVAWNSTLRQFVLSYQDRYIDIIFRTDATPWGPWSKEQRVFGLFDPWASKFIHHPGKDPITQNSDEVWRPDGKPFLAPENSGATYGPYLLDTSTENSDGSVTLYFVLSTWTPYNVWLMKTRLARTR